MNWARLHFVENEGMAFGITFDWAYGKLLLSLFRIVMVLALIFYIRALIQAKMPMGFVFSVGLITAGALGNIIDSAFYGMIFSDSHYHGGLAEMVPFGQGYGTFLHGKVVDMLYFPIKNFELPEWLGGGNWLFFSPIFNVADAAITTGVLSILLFQRRFFKDGFVDSAPADGSQSMESAENEAAEVLEDGTIADNSEVPVSDDVLTPEQPGEGAPVEETK
jgi:signal peptidase II